MIAIVTSIVLALAAIFNLLAKNEQLAISYLISSGIFYLIFLIQKGKP